jgi:hypothetical protein
MEKEKSRLCSHLQEDGAGAGAGLAEDCWVEDSAAAATAAPSHQHTLMRQQQGGGEVQKVGERGGEGWCLVGMGW